MAITVPTYAQFKRNSRVYVFVIPENIKADSNTFCYRSSSAATRSTMWMAFDRWKMKQKQKVTYGSVLRSSLIGCIFLVGPLLMYVGSRQRPVVATGLRQEHVSTFSSPMFSTAIFLHIQSDTPMLEEIAQCMANVVHAANETDIHVFHSATTELNNLNVPVGVGRLTFHVTDESDWVAFIQGLWMLKKKGVFYKSVLKLSNADVILQHRTLEALCGSREQVKSILDVLHDPGPVMVAPMGTVFTPRAPPNKAGMKHSAAQFFSFILIIVFETAPVCMI